MEKIFLGRVKKQIVDSQSYKSEKDNLLILGEPLYIEKHSWDCGWYWGFGYIGNKNLHCHSDIFINKLLWHENKEVFENSIFKENKDFWIFKDLLTQAYALKNVAEVYVYGGHCCQQNGITNVIASKEKAKTINEDLEKVLNSLWDFLSKLYLNCINENKE